MAENNKAMSLENTKQYIKGILQGWITNKSTLDKLSESGGELLFDGNAIGGTSSGGGMTQAERDELHQNTSDIASLSSSVSQLQTDVSNIQVPTKVSDLTNDSGFQNATQVNSAIDLKLHGYQPLLTIDAVLSDTSENPLQNKAIYALITELRNEIEELKNGGIGVRIVSFESGTDQEIKDMLDAHYAGKINIHDYWRVGDTRTVSLSAITAGDGVGESQPAQSVDIVLVNAGGYTTSDGKECAFVWQQKDGLSEPGYMNATAVNTNGWGGSSRKAWCANSYKNALPSAFKELLKICTIKTADPNQSGESYTDTQDEIFLPSMTEVYGTITDQYSIVWTDGYEGSQWDYYKTSSNIYDKKMGTVVNSGGTRLFYWLRSPDRSNATSFMRVPIFQGVPKGSQANTVTANSGQYTYGYMIVPCGFI